MSYEPTLIIRAKDLDDLKQLLDDRQYYSSATFCSEDIRVAEFLNNVLKYEIIEFEDSSFYICQPELTLFNADVREFLDEFDVYYKTFN